VKLADFPQAYLDARDMIWRRYGSQGNVNSVGLGLRITRGNTTAEPAVVVSVTRKFPADLLSSADLLPPSIVVNGRSVAVDVVRAGPFTHAEASTPDAPPAPQDGGLTGTYRPLNIGDSIGPIGVPDKQTGTLGAFVVDKQTSAVCVLSCAHVLADMDFSPLPVGTRITQPGLADGGSDSTTVASLLRIGVLGGAAPVDAAIAKVDSAVDFSNACGLPGMTAPSPDQPAVGLVIAGSRTSNTLCMPIDKVLSALNVDFITPNSVQAAGSTAVGESVQKMGRTTGYSSLNISQVGVTTTINYGVLGAITFPDLIVIEGVFSDSGDAGAVVCAGGTGNGGAPIDLPLGICAFIKSLIDATGILDLGTQTDLQYIDKFRDQYLAQTVVGQLLIGLFYVNSDSIAQRMENDLSSGLITPEQQADAQSFYNSYWPQFTAAVDDPDDAGVITQQEFNSLVVYFSGMYEYGYFSHDEAVAINDIINVVIQPTIGMNYPQLVAYFNQQSVYDQVVSMLSPVSSISWVAGDVPL
jgi:hypothetical protein